MSPSDDDSDSASHTVDTREFLLPGSGLSALLIHGLTGTPYEMRYLGERIAAQGVRALGAKLKGHAAAPEELGATGPDNWYESVVGAFERLRQYGDPIVAVGQSAGAVLAARLAADQREGVAGVVMLAPAFFLFPWTWIRVRLLRMVAPLVSGIYLRNRPPDLHDAAARLVHPNLPLMPLSAAIGLYELSESVQPMLGRVIQPTLIIHSRQDHTCPVGNVDFVMARLGSAHKRAVLLEQSYHVVSVDSEKERVAAEVLGFIAQFRAGPADSRAAS